MSAENGRVASWSRVMELRWRDLDHLGHVYQATYVELLDEARAAWFDDVLPSFEGDEYVLVRQETDYRAELRFEQGPVTISIALERLGTKSVTTRDVISDAAGRVVAEARSIVSMWESAAHRARALTAAERAALSASATLGPEARP